LLNDRFDPNWQVLVDGKRETLLRCNYLMRGVQLTPGEHQVEFRFVQSMGMFYVTLAGVALGVFLCLGLVVLPPPKDSQMRPPAGAASSKSPMAVGAGSR
jgi:hypothetical protein